MLLLNDCGSCFRFWVANFFDLQIQVIPLCHRWVNVEVRPQVGIESWYIIYILMILVEFQIFFWICLVWILPVVWLIYIIILAHQNMGLHLGQIFPVAIQGEASQVARAGCRTHQGAPPGDRMGSSVDILREIYQQPWKVIFWYYYILLCIVKFYYILLYIMYYYTLIYIIIYYYILLLLCIII